MAFFYNTVTKEYPIWLGDAQIDNPEWDGNIENPPTNLVWVEDVIPEMVPNKMLEELEPRQVDGVWVREFAYRDLTTEEVERRDAPANAKAKLLALGLTEAEIQAISRII